MNDDSQDKTEKTILKYSDFNSKIKHIIIVYLGLNDSLNYTLNKANGDWIGRTDVDVISHKKNLSRQKNI